jgi:hypothetical protein
MIIIGNHYYKETEPDKYISTGECVNIPCESHDKFALDFPKTAAYIIEQKTVKECICGETNGTHIFSKDENDQI